MLTLVLNGRRYVSIADGIIKCELGKKCDEVEYHTWREMVPVNSSDRFTVHTHVIEKTPVYKNAYDLLTQVISFSANLSKNVQNPLGIRLKTLVYEMCYTVRTMYDVQDRAESIRLAQEKCTEIVYILQLLKDLKEISLKAFALASERTISVSRQLTALGQKVKAD